MKLLSACLGLAACNKLASATAITHLIQFLMPIPKISLILMYSGLLVYYNTCSSLPIRTLKCFNKTNLCKAKIHWHNSHIHYYTYMKYSI